MTEIKSGQVRFGAGGTRVGLVQMKRFIVLCRIGPTVVGSLIRLRHVSSVQGNLIVQRRRTLTYET